MLQRSTFLVFFFCALCKCENNVNEIPTIVHTKNGIVEGTIHEDYNGEDFLAFQGIPYGKAPVGDLRFRAPEPAEKWEGVLNAKKELPQCPQVSFGAKIGREDCLYLNVYTKMLSGILKPVMVYIHGGSFLEGSAIMSLYGPQFLITEEVVIVSINYRLGAFGFLSLDEEIAGFSTNNGLKDQVLALKWVQENIKQFGGDPKQITIFGESAGGASVHFLMLSPLAKGLFHRAIAQSGVVFMSWAIGMNNSVVKFANEAKIPTDDLNEMINRLRKLTTDEILDLQTNMNFGPQMPYPGIGTGSIEGPGVNSFLPFHPRDIMKSGYYSKVPFMLGFTDQEGMLFDIKLQLNKKIFTFRPEIFVPYSFDPNYKEEAISRMKEFYWDGKEPKTCKEAIDIFTDSMFTYGVLRTAIEHAKHQDNVYLYEFTMDTGLNFFKKLHPITATYSGASHVDDLGYLFKCMFTPTIKPGSIEETLMMRMIKLWTNFAKTGNPTPGKDGLLQNKNWLPVSKNQLNHMRLGESFEVKPYSSKRFDFWNKLFQDYDTHKAKTVIKEEL